MAYIVEKKTLRSAPISPLAYGEYYIINASKELL